MQITDVRVRKITKEGKIRIVVEKNERYAL